MRSIPHEAPPVFTFDRQRRRELDRKAEELAKTIMPHGFWGGDVLINEARRFAFLVNLSGMSAEKAKSETKVSAQVIDHARAFEGLSLEETAYVCGVATIALWFSAFAAMPDTLYGQLWQAAQEKVALGDDAKLN